MNTSFIVLEGPDGSGTTTHTRLLAERLHEGGNDVLLTHEPSGGPIGSWIRSYLQSGAMTPEALQLLFTADRSWHIQEEIKPALAAQRTVVSDRYWLSTVVYAEAMGLDPEPLFALNATFLQPQHQIILLPSFETGISRLSGRAEKEIFETDSLQQRVYEGYKAWAERLQLPIVDTGGEQADVADSIFSIITA